MDSWIMGKPVRAKLLEVEARLVRDLPTCNADVYDIATHLLRGDAKRLRPALLLVCAHCLGDPGEIAVDLAVGVEWLHTATLYHDDVMDEADQRRHGPSVNAKWGNRAATLGGNLLYARAAQIFAAAGDTINRIFSERVFDVWRGQMLETEMAFELQVDEARYLSAIEKKTGSLCELPCQLGAQLSDGSQAMKTALANYGRLIGVAFQLVDDLVDLFGDREALGKPVATDLKEGIYTLPIIQALRRDDALSRKIRCILDQRQVDPSEHCDVIDALRHDASTKQVVARTRGYVAEATNYLAELPDGDCRTSLVCFAERVMGRIPACLGNVF